MQTVATGLTQSEVKNLIDTRLADYCEARIADAQVVSPRYTELWQSIDRLLKAGGKRFRPYMLLSTYLAYSQNNSEESSIEAVVPAAMAQEFVHVAMLVHDDIIDRDDVRYGIKNVTGHYKDIYEPLLPDIGERTHMARSASLLAGDALLSESYRMLSTVNGPALLVQKATEIFANGVFEVIGGELLDTESGFFAKGTVNAELVARYKTASYSFISPLTSGAVLAGASGSEIMLLQQFSEYLGVGYQLRDDLLGVYGDSEKTGKSTSTDIIEGKQTYLIEQFDKLASEDQKHKFDALFHKADATDEQISIVKQLLVDSGAKAKVQSKIDELRQKAIYSVEQLSIPSESKEGFLTLIDRCLDREA